MSRLKQASKRKRLTKAAAVPALGAAGLGLSLVGSASASTLPTADVPQALNTTPNQRFVLGEEEMADVSLATFHLFDKENGTGGFTQVARWMPFWWRWMSWLWLQRLRLRRLRRLWLWFWRLWFRRLLPIVGCLPFLLIPVPRSSSSHDRTRCQQPIIIRARVTLAAREHASLKPSTRRPRHASPVGGGSFAPNGPTIPTKIWRGRRSTGWRFIAPVGSARLARSKRAKEVTKEG